jgi:hypothetical protein
LRIEDATTGRAQCRRCRWRCIIESDGSTRGWLRLGSNRTALLPSISTSTPHEESCLRRDVPTSDTLPDELDEPVIDTTHWKLADIRANREFVQQFIRRFAKHCGVSIGDDAIEAYLEDSLNS